VELRQREHESVAAKQQEVEERRAEKKTETGRRRGASTDRPEGKVKKQAKYWWGQSPSQRRALDKCVVYKIPNRGRRRSFPFKTGRWTIASKRKVLALPRTAGVSKGLS
jgi:hypothetical protein